MKHPCKSVWVGVSSFSLVSSAVSIGHVKSAMKFTIACPLRAVHGWNLIPYSPIS